MLGRFLQAIRHRVARQALVVVRDRGASSQNEHRCEKSFRDHR
jgi:hypothetical protein